MKKTLKQYLRGQSGQALPIVLCVLAIGGLTLAGNLNYSTTSIKGGRIDVQKSKGAYAAEAGVENVLWSLVHSQTPPTQLGSTVNGNTVSIVTANQGYYVLYLGGLEPSVHTDWLDVTSNVTPYSGNTYNYIITIERLTGSPKNMKLLELGSVLPPGYNYVPGSAAAFPGSISTADPTSSGNTSIGSVWIKWSWNQGHGPYITGNQTQGFRITGEGSTTLTFSWVIIQSNDISLVGDVSGTRYRITSTARQSPGGKITSVVTADVLIDNQAIYILSWQVAN